MPLGMSMPGGMSWAINAMMRGGGVPARNESARYPDRYLFDSTIAG
jgi:hypothetical protein